MEAVTLRVDEDSSAGNGKSEPDLKPKSTSSKRRRLSRSKKDLSGRMMNLLEEKISFPDVSKCRRQFIKASTLFPIIISARDERSDSCALSKEYKIASYFDTECPVYSQSFPHAPPKVEEGKQLDVIDLLGGDNLLRFSTSSSQNVPSILPARFPSYVGSGSPDKGMPMSDSGMCIPVNGGRNVHRVLQTPVLRRCVNVVGGGVMAASTSSTGKKEDVNVESTLSLEGKYVMICCVFVPSIWSSVDGPRVYHTALASHELARRDDFVLVVVPMMRKGFTHSESAYRHFLSGFSCLAVPFHDSRRREFICSALGFDGKIRALMIDPSQKVLYHGMPDMFDEFGGAEHDWFPFTPEREDICIDRDDVLDDRSLDELLDLSDTDVLYNIEYLAGGGKLKEEEDGRVTTISQLKQKFVGLYVYSDGRSLRRLQQVHEECRRRKYELEIVVVCCPFYRQVPPKLHEELLIDALASSSHELLQGWWFLPFNNTVCHRLRRMSEIDSGSEGLFIVDPIGKYVDPYGFPIIGDFGMDSYPFTRRKVIEEEFQRKMGLRLNSLLPYEFFSHSGFNSIPRGALLKDKIVVVYLYREKCFANELAAWYKKNIKKKHSNVEIVAVSTDGSCTSDEYFLDMGWLVCRVNPSESAKICKEYFHPLCEVHEVVVAFGEDGLIQSVDASHILESQHPPFHGDDLREEIALEFQLGGFEYMGR